MGMRWRRIIDSTRMETHAFWRGDNARWLQTAILPEILDKVFEPFFTTKQVGAGSGLGLSMVQGFARQSSGALFIEGLVGRGTCVTLYLPRTAEAIIQLLTIIGCSVMTAQRATEAIRYPLGRRYGSAVRQPRAYHQDVAHISLIHQPEDHSALSGTISVSRP